MARFTDCNECPEMVMIPAGSFAMGSSTYEIQNELTKVPLGAGPFGILYIFAQSNRQRAARFMLYEQPQHTVNIDHSFAMGRYPVTREEFGAFVKETGYQTGLCWLRQVGHAAPPVRNAWANPGYLQIGRDPVVCVSWDDAQAYLRWLNKKTSHDARSLYRLPSEAEWEFAARGGTSTQYWWGDEVGNDHTACDGCNWPGPRSMFVGPVQGTVPVGAFPPNPFGMSDILGNVAQIVHDCWHESYVGAPSDGSSWMTVDCRQHTTRGGSWRGPAWAARAAARSGQVPYQTVFDEGFRVVKDVP